MSLLMNVGSSGALKVILTNSPHLLEEPELVNQLWERFCRKEFSALLKKKMAQHHETNGDIPFPLGTWEEEYDELAVEHFRTLKEDFEKAAASMRALNKAKETKKAILVEDPREVINARPRGLPGASFRPRTATTPMQKFKERARQEAFQRNQAMAKAKEEMANPTHNSFDSALRSRQLSTAEVLIRKPAKSLSKRARGLEALRSQREASPNYRRRTVSSSPEGAPAVVAAAKSAFNQSDSTKSTASETSVNESSPTRSATKKPLPPPATISKKPTATTTRSQPPGPHRTLFQNPTTKIYQAITDKTIVKHKDGSITTTVWTDWDKFQNRQLFATFSREKQDRLLAEKPNVVFTPAPNSSNKKRPMESISAANDTKGGGGASQDGGLATLPQKDTASSPRPVKKARGAAGVFMPARRR